MNFRNKKTGFTLIELLIVIAIVGVLSGVVLQSLQSARIRSRNAGRLAQIDQINKALELGATGGTNKLPLTSGYACLGLTADTSPTCGGVFNPTNTAADNFIKANIAGGVIPRDSNLISGVGTAYIYHSNLTPATSGNCTASSCPNGAYLSWVVEKSTTCGRGVYWIPNVNGVTGDSQCLLRIGNAVTN